MTPDKILLSYKARLAELQASSSRLRRSHISALVIFAGLLSAFAFLTYRALAHHNISFTIPLLLLPAILYAGWLAKLRHRSLRESLRLQIWHQSGIGRLSGEWSSQGFQGTEFSIDGHSYEKDLNVLGQFSLFQRLCTCRTEVGRRQLAHDLLTTPSLEIIRARQEAIKELQPLFELREKVQLLGEFSFQESNWQTIADWLQSPVTKSPAWLRLIALASSASLASILLVAITFYFPWSYFQNWVLALLLFHAALALVYRTRVLAAMQPARAIGNEIGVLCQGLALLQKCNFQSPLLVQLVQSVRSSQASRRIHKLERFIGFMTERDKDMFYGISRALLIGTQAFLAMESWRSENATAMEGWLSAWGEFEALLALAHYAYENPDHCYPEFTETSSLLCAAAVGHPLLPPAECIRNDISWGDHCKLYIVSGSNMAGKSTLLRTIGLNVVLAYAGAPVGATKFVLSRFALCASITVHDSLSNRKSKFLAEVDRLKQALQVPLDKAPVLFLIDEILSGTNSKDRRTAAQAIIGALIARGAMGALSTHDLSLTELAALPELRALNVHMGSRDDADPLDFDYLVKPGVTNQSSALAIARLAGVNVSPTPAAHPHPPPSTPASQKNH